MSLLYWLPLNGNINNNGLSSLSPIPSDTLAYNDNGKIGKCFQSGSQYISLPLENVPTEISICVWVKPNSPNPWTNIFSLGVNANRMEVSTTTQYYWFCDSSSTQLIASGTELFTLDNSVWNHVCMTADGTTVKFYLNGIIVKTVSQINSFSDVFGDNLKINIGARIAGNYMYPGYMNDFRVYNHCLSAKEVKEISKGLVCHYPLKSQYETGQVNKYSGDVAEGYLTENFTRTKLEGERGYNYKLTYTGTGNNNWFNLKAGNFSFTAGKKYYYSCKVRCHSTNFGLYLRASRSDNDWVTNATNVLNPDGEWHEYVVYQTINETYDRAGSTVTCNPTLEFYSDNLSTPGKVYSADFDIKDIQVIESDCYVPFIDNDMVSNVVSDCSGYGNNGTQVGMIAWKNDSPRYSGSYYFSKSASRYIYRDTRFGFLKNLTFSCWINQMDRVTAHGTEETGLQFVMSQGRDYRDDSNLSYGFNIVIVNGYVHIISLNTYVNTGYLLDLNKWYHICQTFDGSYIRLYVNGNCIYTAADNTTDLWNNDGNAFVIGKMSYSYMYDDYFFPFVGKISDARVYATALSEEDVKALYNTSASICKTGVLSAYEFVEEG